MSKNLLINLISLLCCMSFGKFFCQNLGDKTLEEKIYYYNNNLQYQKSQDILLNIINSQKPKQEKYFACILMSYTYKRVFDYETANKYVFDAYKYCTNDKDSLRLDALYSMNLFDTQNYEASLKIINGLEEKNFYGLTPDDKAIIIMQLGYIKYLKGDFAKAENCYSESLEIMNRNKTCNQPIVIGKMFKLYNSTGRKTKLDSLYNTGIEIAERCNIIKYKLYLTEELIKTIDKNDKNKMLLYKNKYDTLSTIYSADESISKLHNLKELYLTKKLQKTNSDKKTFVTLFIIISVFSILFLFVLFIRNKKKTFETAINTKPLSESEFIEDVLTFEEPPFEEESLSDEKFETVEDLLNSNYLTLRQKDILRLLIEGNSNNQISEKLFITLSTVKFHVKNVNKILAQMNLTYPSRKQGRSTKLQIR